MAEAPGQPTLLDIYLCFLKISLLGMGGSSALWIWEEVVVRRRWIDEQKFAEGVSLSQMVPGANVVNLAVFVGATLRGITGAVIACAGLVVVPALILLAVGSYYLVLRQFPLFKSVLAGIAAAAIGMNFAIGFRLLMSQKFDLRVLIVVAVIVVTVGILRLSLPPVLLIVCPLSLLLALLTDRMSVK